MWLIILTVVFIIGGIIYEMGKTDNDTDQLVKGGVNGLVILFAILQCLAPVFLVGALIVMLFKACT